jgi:hypothetical protein
LKGFAHHLLLPVIAVVAIGGVGTYVFVRSHANVLTGSAICGSGYAKVVSYNVHGSNKNLGPGVVTVYRNSTVKKLCAVQETIKTSKAYGTSKPMMVRLTLGNNISLSTVFARDADPDSGTASYLYYAGPVYVSYVGHDSTNTWYSVEGSMKYGGVSYGIGSPRNHL